MDQNAYELGVQIATLVAEMKHVREGLESINKKLDTALPALDERVRKLETEQLVWKTRVAMAASLGSGAGAVIVFLVNKIW